MTRDEAFARVLKLREVTRARGASVNEARVAAVKADRLVRRFGLDMREPQRAWQASRPRGRPTPARVFVVDWPQDWSFDAVSGEHSPNVKVHEYRNRANWRIEIDPSGADERWELFAGRGAKRVDA